TREGSAASVKVRAAGGRRSGARDVLVATQTAMAAVLLIGAVLLARSYVHLVAVDPGFRSNDVLLMNVALPLPTNAPDAARARLIYEALSERTHGMLCARR